MHHFCRGEFFSPATRLGEEGGAGFEGWIAGQSPLKARGGSTPLQALGICKGQYSHQLVSHFLQKVSQAIDKQSRNTTVHTTRLHCCSFDVKISLTRELEHIAISRPSCIIETRGVMTTACHDRGIKPKGAGAGNERGFAPIPLNFLLGRDG